MEPPDRPGGKCRGCQENRLRRLPLRQMSCRRERFRCFWWGLIEQEVVLHVPLKRIIIPRKEGVVKGERQGREAGDREREREE